MLSISSPSPPVHAHTHTYPYICIYIHLSVHLGIHLYTNWLYFIALSKHRIRNELFLRKMAMLCLGFRESTEVILDSRLLGRRNYVGENEQQVRKRRGQAYVHAHLHFISMCALALRQ